VRSLDVLTFAQFGYLARVALKLRALLFLGLFLMATQKNNALAVIVPLFVDTLLKRGTDGLPLSPVTGKPLYSDGINRTFTLAASRESGVSMAELIKLRDADGSKLAFDAEPFVKHGLRGMSPGVDGKRGISWLPLTNDEKPMYRNAAGFWSLPPVTIIKIRGFRDAASHTDSLGKLSDAERTARMAANVVPARSVQSSDVPSIIPTVATVNVPTVAKSTVKMAAKSTVKRTVKK